MDDYSRWTSLQLGSDIITVEIEGVIPDIVELAFLELKHYMTDVRTMTLPYNKKIDLSGRKISNIVYIMRSKNTSIAPGYQDIIYTTSGRGSNFSVGNYVNRLLKQQTMNTISTDLDYHYDKHEECLYIYAHYPLPTSVTIVYTPEYDSVDEIIEPFWQNLLRRLSLALTKEALGRARGKYHLTTATYNLDADQLLNEAQAELSEIRAYLNSNIDMILPID